jgi:hypothetical protein
MDSHTLKMSIHTHARNWHIAVVTSHKALQEALNATHCHTAYMSGTQELALRHAGGE